MAANASILSTPTPTTKAPGSPPGAPAKRRLDKHAAWGEFVDGLKTMPAKDARKLKAQDMGVHFGPIMDEAQFEAYRKSRQGGVHVVSMPQNPLQR